MIARPLTMKGQAMLDHHAPRREPEDINDYWAKRRDHDLYRLTFAMARAMFPHARSAIDVGCYTSALLCEMDWIPRRVASDMDKWLVRRWQGVEGVEFVLGDAFELDFGEPFDLVISNQTIEHVEDAKGFAEKLLTLGRGVIVSTTYETPAGLIEGHIQDPISLEKFQSWFPRPLDAWTICHHPTAGDRIKHIIGVLKPD